MAAFFAKRRTATEATARRPREGAVAVRRYRACDGFEALIPEALVERCFAFARSCAPREWIALLAVRKLRDARGEYVIVEGVLPFDGARGTTATVATTIDGEARARLLLEQLFPDSEVGGWLHTHPGHGLFLSSTDRITQQTWSSPTALALVVDHTVPGQLFVARGPDAEEMRLVAPSRPTKPKPRAPDPPARPKPRRIPPLSFIAACLLGLLAGATSTAAALALRRVDAELAAIRSHVEHPRSALTAESKPLPAPSNASICTPPLPAEIACTNPDRDGE